MVARTVQRVVWRRQGTGEVMLHSDRGIQFSSGVYQKFLAGTDLVQSVSAVGRCGDNAVCDGFFGLLERERVVRRRYRTCSEARPDVFDYLERYYNPRVRHRIPTQDQKFLALNQTVHESGAEPSVR